MLKEECPTAEVSELTARVAAEWEALTEEDRAPWMAEEHVSPLTGWTVGLRMGL